MILRMPENYHDFLLATDAFFGGRRAKRVGRHSTEWKLPVFGVFQVRIQSESGEIQARKSPNTDTFHTMSLKKKKNESNNSNNNNYDNNSKWSFPSRLF